MAHRALLGAAAAALLACSAAPQASATAPTTRYAYAPGEIVPLPASIPHQAGVVVDRRIVPNLRWLAQRFPIYVTEGYSGRLPGGGEHVGCRGCHVKNSDHHRGLAVDIVAVRGGNRCDRSWRGITRLARWAEPRRNRPRAPFRWVGYDGDRGHGCGHHLHLSWNHAPTREFQIAEWVEVFRVNLPGAPPAQPRPEPAPTQPEPAPAPPGGISTVRSGGVSPSS